MAGSAQCMFLALGSGITPSGVERTIRDRRIKLGSPTSTLIIVLTLQANFYSLKLCL